MTNLALLWLPKWDFIWDPFFGFPSPPKCRPDSVWSECTFSYWSIWEDSQRLGEALNTRVFHPPSCTGKCVSVFVFVSVNNFFLLRNSVDNKSSSNFVRFYFKYICLYTFLVDIYIFIYLFIYIFFTYKKWYMKPDTWRLACDTWHLKP